MQRFILASASSLLFAAAVIITFSVSGRGLPSLLEAAPEMPQEQPETTVSAVTASDMMEGDGPARTLFTPVPEIYGRITVKPFGEYFTPELSPVGDHFIGWHTAIDIEYTEADQDIPVFAIADGTVLRAEWAHGYGGVVVIRHTIDGTPQLALYGHMDYHDLPPVGSIVTAGEQIGYLGEDHSYETDGNRKHLHFGLPVNEPVDIRGYVQHEYELSGWTDPRTLFPEECTTPAPDLMSPGTVSC